ncbi:MAG: hypothetical protein JSV88_21615 [Candidatus Aminicenantes bacterium]|nr:MAG: hypothetical protein JSV88_21615 [Candidatus Aminicenantes bacterium]
MNRKSNPTVLFYPTGIVHFRNLEILKKNLSGFRFRVILEPWVNKKAPGVLQNIEKQDWVMVEKGQLPGKGWENVDILFLSMAYPNPFRLHLVYEAAKRNIPVIAIEEVNQLALNQGMINHYFLPIDYLGVPSDVEKEKFLELGVSQDALYLTGWPFFDYKAALENHRYFDMRKKYNLQPDKKSCLLILGSLKERDMVSLETRGVRQEILDIVTMGLTEGYQLLIKPHPIETEAGLQEIQKQAPDAVLLNPEHPIEPLLAQADLVVNRGNSQVTLLALVRNKPLIVVPAGLKTIFHGVVDSIISNSASEFRRILVDYSRGEKKDYEKILTSHFPLTQTQAMQKVNELFTAALKKKITNRRDKKIYISILYAFLEDMVLAKQIVDEAAEEEAASLLEKLYNHKITPGEFGVLLNHFPGKIIRWHLQALFIRSLIKRKNKTRLSEAKGLLEGFDGEVNPHYFIEDLVKRIELEYQAGNEIKAEQLFKKFYEDYSVFDYYKQAFDILHFVYHHHHKYFSFRKALWLLMNPNKAYTRKYIKNILKG